MDVKTFAELEETPTLDKVDLLLLTEYYEAYLVPYIYSIRFEDGSEIEIKFNQDNFCHLIGLHKPAEKKFGKHSYQVKLYKGNKGYVRIKDGSITKPKLKALNKGAYSDMRDKMVNFYKIHTLLENAEAVYYTTVVNNITSIDILLYESTTKSYIQLGILKKDNQTYYIPTTFLIEPITEHSDGKKFIKDQAPVKIEKREKIRNPSINGPSN
ncbi:PBECR4 domain-containing protein [Lysinibacillus sp. NPDC098008]|uniref:PBECR4 domain-containing protein n=1 Tax=Lysinibacillus sp. NPDC098008 TaxID=3364146 RepID=UPI0038262181